MPEIQLANTGAVALVDECDVERLAGYRWLLSGGGYAVRREGQKVIGMHQEVLDATEGHQVDHRNGDGLDNRRENLRVANRSQQMRNRHAFRRRKDNTTQHSDFKGVRWDKDRRQWRVRIRVHGKQLHIGRFVDEVEAAHAYDRAARRLHGSFARLNFPRKGEQSARRRIAA